MSQTRTEMDLFDVSGKVVVVTGAGTGLGAGYARAFGAAGATVVCAGRTLKSLEETVTAVREAGGKALALTVDVTKPETLPAFLKVTPEQFDAIVGVNLRGAFFMAQAAANAMGDRGGKIINIGSLGSYIGLAQSSVYCATKGAVIQMTRTMAIELAPRHIQVNAIAPGYFVTPMTQPFYDDPEHRAWIEGRIPAGRWGTTEDLAGPAIFLASAASDYITGQVIIVDGGWLAS